MSVCERRLRKHILSHIISCNWLGIRSSVLFSISQQIYETAEPVWAIIIFIFHFNHTSDCKLKVKTATEEFPHLLSLPITGGDHLLLVIALYKWLFTIGIVCHIFLLGTYKEGRIHSVGQMDQNQRWVKMYKYFGNTLQ